MATVSSSATSSKTIGIEFVGSPCSGPSASVTVGATRSMTIVTTNTEAEALLLEAQLIKRFRPPYNVLLRDDKSFPFILLRADHAFPRIMKHRGARKAQGNYYGPFASAGSVFAPLKMNRVRALAVTTRKRLSDFPALPTMIEAGVANYEASVWNGVLAPTGTPRDIVTRLNTQTAQAIRELTPTLAEMGAYPMTMSPDEYAEFVRREIGKWANVVKISGARAE